MTGAQADPDRLYGVLLAFGAGGWRGQGAWPDRHAKSFHS